MEVLMKRSRRRISRAVGMAAALVICIGLVFIFRRIHRSKPAAAPAAPLRVTVASSPAAKKTASPAKAAPTLPPIETATPASLVAPATAALPTTRPAAQEAGWSQLLATGAVSTPAAAQSSAGNGQNAPGNSAPVAALAQPAAATVADPVVSGSGPVADGRARMAAGQLISARAILNSALQSGTLSAGDAAAAMSLISQINQTVIFSPQPFANDPYGGEYLVKPGDSLAKIAADYSTTWGLLARINRIEPRRLRAGATIKIIRGPFFAVVRKAAFTLDVYLGALPGGKGSMYVTSFPVGLGRDNSTPTGLWAIETHAKLQHPTYYPPEGGTPIEADDPNNPLGGYWIGLTGVQGQAVGQQSYGMHGTNDQASIGHQSSLGCIRLNSADIPLLFDMMVGGKSMVRVMP
jgi:lipoprotein-anchoring transpeptidase ErfK/SrfK